MQTGEAAVYKTSKIHGTENPGQVDLFLFTQVLHPCRSIALTVVKRALQLRSHKVIFLKNRTQALALYSERLAG